MHARDDPVSIDPPGSHRAPGPGMASRLERPWRPGPERAGAPEAARPTVPVAGVLLAAGGGSRLGNRPKALLEYRGRPLVERVAALLAASGCAPVHVVLGAGREAVWERVERSGWVPVANPGWERGMGSSLRAGLASLRATAAPAALVMLVDQPRIGAPAIERVLAAHHGQTVLAAATYQGRRGHPVLLGRQHWEGVATSARGDRGARDYLRRHHTSLTLVECGDVAAPDDIDHPADLALLDPESGADGCEDHCGGGCATGATGGAVPANGSGPGRGPDERI